MSTINYNFAANVAANNLAKNERLLDVTMNKLSSGQRVGVGTNEPGALGLYNRLSEEGTTLRAGLDNVNYTISSLKVVESVAMTMNTMGNRLLDLAIKASSTTMNTQDRYALDGEFQSILTEMERLATETQFNGTDVMIGTDIKVNYGEGTEVLIRMDDFRPSARLGTTGDGIAMGALNDNSAGSSGGAASALTSTAVAAAAEVPATSFTTISTADFAALTKTILDARLPALSEAIGRLGGAIRSLEFAAEAQATKAVGAEAGASKVGDTDYAIETARLASAQVISQAATAILAQANARSSTVLTLLK
jgi:flagellin